MNDSEYKKRKPWHQRGRVWAVIGVVVLIILLFFWLDIADLSGAGDGGTNDEPMAVELNE